jgi:hypothetical protein
VWYNRGKSGDKRRAEALKDEIMVTRTQIDEQRRQLARAAWAGDTKAFYAHMEQIQALYAQLDPVRCAPQPTGLKLAGRAADGSYIFTSTGEIAPYKTARKDTPVRRRASKRAFEPGHYRVDSEFANLFPGDLPPLPRADVTNDLFFLKVQK